MHLKSACGLMDINIMQPEKSFSKMCVCVYAGDAGGNSGEDIQLTTTITNLDGPSEIYKLAGKDAQE